MAVVICHNIQSPSLRGNVVKSVKNYGAGNLNSTIKSCDFEPFQSFIEIEFKKTDR